ncbi:MAG: YhgE/Pip domain-containing protein [Paracoccaceae bacterium]
MITALNSIRHSTTFRAAILVPAAIALIFSLFNLTAPPDSQRIAQAVHIGVVNLDSGKKFPPVNAGRRITQRFADQMPFAIDEFESEIAARDALDAQKIAAFLVLDETFTADVFGEDPVAIRVVSAGNLTRAESQIAGQLPTMLQTGIAAAVTSLRLALARGQLPTGELPVELSVETINEIRNPAAGMAPFVASFAMWLAAMVGALLLFVATSQLPGRFDRAMIRSAIPIVTTGLSSLVLAIILATTSGLDAGFMAFWLTSWIISLALGWLFCGAFSLLGLVALIFALPVVFYQASVGGTQMPLAAAPGWLQSIGDVIPFDHLGAVLRSLIIGGQSDPLWGLVAITGGLGLLLIWLTPVIRRPG